MNDFQTKSFINILAGLSKVILFTEPTHEAHSILNENLAQYTPVINEIFKFNHKEAENTTNFVYLAIEKYSNDCEGYMCQLAANISRSATKDFSDFVDNRKTFIRPDEASQIIMRNRQISTQLQRFASGMKNTQTKGLKKYIEMWRSMSSENGPWCPPEMSFTHHWKLDKSLQNNLRRGLMKENYTFSDHSDASFLRDTASHVVPGNSIPEEDSYQNRLKKLRITDFTGDKTVQLLFEAEEIEDNKIRTQPDDIIIKVDTKYVTMRSVNSGSLMLTSEYLIFDSASKYFEIEMDTIVSVFQRRYLLRDTSIEIFTTLHRSFFFDFVDDQRDQIIQNIYKLKPKNIKFIQVQPKSLDSLIEKAEKRWQRGKLSNFDYLMSINYFAGRTYNDLGQYPVFPWVLSNYTSKELNLRDSTVFRDLTKPLGAMTPERLSMLKKRLLTEDDLEYQYLYGSFYTSAAVVIGYMIRVEPFTSLHIELQSGKFDNPDRLFNSIPKAWDSVNHMMMDFRELIPEFYYSPDFLINTNNFDLGLKNNGDVELPPWASSAADFVRKNRAALESPVISATLPYWIDMTFGITSRGSRAIKIDNYFHPLFFSDVPRNVDVSTDQDLLFQTEFAACFGQAPNQIFHE